MIAGNNDLLNAAAREIWQPAPDVPVWQWAEANLHLGAGETENPGPYRSNITPYIREPLEAFRDPAITDMALMFGSQTAKTMVLMVGAAWTLENNPGGILWVLPNETIARSFSESRWQPMIRSSPALARLMPDSPDDFNKLEQRIAGSIITFVGSNSPANLASRPKRTVIQDETDKFPESGRREGSASGLADQRTKRYTLPFRVKTSTPTITSGTIYKEHSKGDCRKYLGPCPNCGEPIELFFEQIKWNSAAKRADGKWNLEEVRKSARYECQVCAGMMDEHQKGEFIEKAQWTPTNPDADPAYRSYHLASWYAPWLQCSFGNTATKFLQAKAIFDLITFDTGERGLPSEEEASKQDWEVLAARRESYPQAIPPEVLVITAGVDVQDNRLEAELVGWGAGKESWTLEHAIFYGRPERDAIWRELAAWIFDPRERKTGETKETLQIDATAIDTGGHFTTAVYEFAKRHQGRRVHAIKGSNQASAPIIGRASRRNKLKVPLYAVGTGAIKEDLFAFFKIAEAGPGYMHFIDHLDDEYFKQLCAEECISRYVKGYEVKEWHKIRKRNEALDCRVYAYAALHILPRNLLASRESARQLAGEPGETAKIASKPVPRRNRRRRNTLFDL